MIKEMLYIVGAPGVGKSTLMRELTTCWDKQIMEMQGVPVTQLSTLDGIPRGMELGRPRRDFPGTDSLSMSISPRAVRMLGDSALSFAVGEGQRLGTQKFLGSLVDLGVSLNIVYLWTSDATLNARCAARGSAQNTSWRQGAATQARNVADWAETCAGKPVKSWWVNAEQEVSHLADTVRKIFPSIQPGHWQ